MVLVATGIANTNRLAIYNSNLLFVGIFVLVSRVLYLEAQFRISLQSFISRGRVLNILAKFSISWHNFISPGRVVHLLAEFCISLLSFVSRGKVLNMLAKFCISFVMKVANHFQDYSGWSYPHNTG